MKWQFLSQPKNIFLITLFLSVVPLFTIFSKIWLGEFAFWYDPARDLLSAVDNLSKPTLIGPTSGIPGVFYGPYWIWILSIGTLISLDPRIVTIVAVTLPYVILFPFILSRFSPVINPFVLALLWLFFLLGYHNYFTDLWNPHLAPLFILITIYLLFTLTHVLSVRNMLTTFFAGFSMGLVMNFHLSLGIGMFLGVMIYLAGTVVVCLIKVKKKQRVLLTALSLGTLFFLGCIAAFSPFILFEVRHQFLQTQTLLQALFQYGGVVSLQGLTQAEILQNFLGSMAKLFQVSVILAGIIVFVALGAYIVIYRKRKDHVKEKELKLLAILGCIMLGIVFIYLTAKNPIWEYHFIGVEIIFLLLIGVMINTSSHMQKIAAGWVMILIALSMFSFFSKIDKEHDVIAGTLIAKQQVVEKVVQEADGADYTVFAYNPAIYTYDYAYLFTKMYGKELSYRPELIPVDKDVVFVIFPEKTDKSTKEEFIDFKTPPGVYKTVESWILPDGTEILKRKKI